MFLASCTPRKLVAQPQPEAAPDTIPISFKRVLIKIPPGKLIGTHGTALTHLPLKRYYWESSWLVGEQQFNQIAIEELKNAGYQAIDTVTVFESGNEGKAKLLLGGTIEDMTFDTYAHVTELGHLLAGNSSKASILIKWEIMDRNLKRVIYEKTTTGAGAVRGINVAAIYGAFRDSIRKLFADREFSSLLRMTREITPGKVATPSEPILIEKISFPQNLKALDLIQKSIQAVVTIRTERGHGSGFIISENGYIITNYHPVLEKQHIEILLPNKIVLEGEVVRVNHDLDLALLKLKGTGFPALPLGNSDSIQPGEEVFAIGTPLLVELGQSVSKGIISGIRKVEEKDYIQADVKVNPGNSGGPLMNSKGEVVGVITMKLVGEGIEGLTFSIPINTVSKTFNIITNK